MPKKQKLSVSSHKESSHQLHEEDAWQESIELTEESYGSNLKGLGNTGSTSRAKKERTNYQNFNNMVEEPFSKQENSVIEDLDFEEEFAESYNQDPEEEEDDDFNLGLLVPKSFDHDPDIQELSCSFNSLAITDKLLERVSIETPLETVSQPVWKKQPRPCLANSQLETKAWAQIPARPSVAVDKLGIARDCSHQCWDVSAAHRSDMKVAQGESLESSVPKGTPELSLFRGGSKSTMANRHPREVVCSQPKAMKSNPVCAECVGKEHHAKSSRQPHQPYSTHPVLRQTSMPRTDVFPPRKHRAFPDREGRPFVLCSSLLDERIQNYRLNIVRRRIGPIN